MAAKDILAEALADTSRVVPRDITDRFYSTPGLTDELRDKAFYESYGGAVPSMFMEDGAAPVIDEPTMPILKNIIAVLGLKDDPANLEGGRTALQKFVDDFPKKQKDWKKKVEANEQWGEKGWQTVRDTWRQTVNDDMNRRIREERETVMEGNADDQDWRDWLASAGLGFVASHSKNALKEGRDPTKAEIAGDIFENAAFAVPMGGPGVAIARGLRHVPFVKRGAAKVLGGAASQFIAPTAVEGFDTVVDNNDFEWEDPLIGGATNLGVNKGLGRTIGAIMGLGKVRAAKSIPKPIKERLEGVKTPKERAYELVEDSRRIIDDATNTTEKEYFDRIQAGEAPVATTEEQQKAIDILKLAEVAQKPEKVKALEEEARLQVEGLNKEIDNVKRMKKDLANRYLEGKLDADELARATQHEQEMGQFVDEEIAKGRLRDDGIPYTREELLAEDFANNRLGPVLGILEKQLKTDMGRWVEIRKASKAGEVLRNLDDNKDLKQLMNQAILDGELGSFTQHLTTIDRNPVAKVEKELGIKPGMLKDNPELLALFDYKPPVKAADVLGDMALTYGVNRAGTDTDASALTTLTHGMVNPKDLRKRQYEKREKRKGSAAVLSAIAGLGDSLTDEDRVFLNAIADNPGIVKTGYSSEGDPDGSRFRLWMLTRGNDILRENAPDAYRPTWEIEQ